MLDLLFYYGVNIFVYSLAATFLFDVIAYYLKEDLL